MFFNLFFAQKHLLNTLKTKIELEKKNWGAQI